MGRGTMIVRASCVPRIGPGTQPHFRLTTSVFGVPKVLRNTLLYDFVIQAPIFLRVCVVDVKRIAGKAHKRGDSEAVRSFLINSMNFGPCEPFVRENLAHKY